MKNSKMRQGVPSDFQMVLVKNYKKVRETV